MDADAGVMLGIGKYSQLIMLSVIEKRVNTETSHWFTV